MKLGYETAKTLNSLADKLQEVGKQPDKFELDPRPTPPFWPRPKNSNSFWLRSPTSRPDC